MDSYQHRHLYWALAARLGMVLEGVLSASSSFAGLTLWTSPWGPAAPLHTDRPPRRSPFHWGDLPLRLCQNSAVALLASHLLHYEDATDRSLWRSAVVANRATKRSNVRKKGGSGDVMAQNSEVTRSTGRLGFLLDMAESNPR